MINGVMMLADGDEFNGLTLPVGWTTAFTGNPEEGHNVTSLDDAQFSRTVLLAYNRPNEVFFDQCAIQGVNPKLQNYWIKDQSQVDQPVVSVQCPKNNDRIKMLFARIFDYLEHDLEALKVVAMSMFGTGWVQAFNAALEGFSPPEPDQILDAWETVRGRVYEAKEMQRTDVLMTSTTRLVSHVVLKGTSYLTKERCLNFERYAVMLPESDQKLLCKRMTTAGLANHIAGHTMVSKEGGGSTNGQWAQRAASIQREQAAREREVNQ